MVEVTSKQPTMWKCDPLADAELRLSCSIALHRQAGVRGYYCSPKRSHIQRGTYYAEVGQHTWDDRPEFSGLVRPNVALGTGRTPTLAAMDGYQKAGLDDLLMRAIYLEIETYYLAEAVKTYGKLDRALEGLGEVLELSAAMFMAGEIVPFDEDDDL